MMQHEFPMEPIIRAIVTESTAQMEDDCLKVCQSYGFDVNKERLQQALTDARKFYEEGYEAGKRAQMHWIDANEQVPPDEKPVLCHYGFDHGYGINPMTFIGVLSYFAFDPTPHWQHASHDLVVTHWMPLPEKPSM